MLACNLHSTLVLKIDLLQHTVYVTCFNSCLEGDNQRLVASAPYQDIEITLEKPRVQAVAGKYLPF